MLIYVRQVFNHFDNADPSSMQDDCHIWTHLKAFALHEFS